MQIFREIAFVVIFLTGEMNPPLKISALIILETGGFNYRTLTIICLFVFLGELAVGNLWDVCFGVKLWDYSNMPLHITQYAGLIPTLGYGCGAYLLFKLAYQPALKLVRKKVKYKVAVIVNCTLGILIAADMIRMCLTIIIAGQAPMFWSIKVR